MKFNLLNIVKYEKIQSLFFSYLISSSLIKDIILVFFEYIKKVIITSKNNLLNNYIISFHKQRKERVIG